jgi:hypothetical protein
MQPVSADRIPVERPLEGFAAYEEALDELLANCERAVRVFDRAIGSNYNSPHRYQLMRRVLLARRSNRIFIVLHETSNIVRDCPRLMMLLRQFSGQLSIHHTLPAARGACDPFVIGDDDRFVRRFHYDHARGVAAVGNPVDTHALSKRFQEIWEASAPAVSATVIGL